MEQLKAIKSTLVSLVQSQLGDIQHTDAKELGEVVDMIKDLEEAMYYCSIVKAMEKAEEEKESGSMTMGFRERYPHGEYDYDTMDWRPYFYYQQSGRGSANQYGGSGGRGGNRGYAEMMGYEGGGRSGYSEMMEYYGGQGGSGSGQGGSQGGSGGGSQGGSSGQGSTAYYGGPNYYYSEGQQGMSKGDIKQVGKYLNELNEELPHMMEKSSPEEKKMLSEKLTQISNKINK